MPPLKHRHQRATWLAITIAVSSVVASSHPAHAAGRGPAAAEAQVVQIRNFAFVPAIVTVRPGTTVTWTNADEDPHSVVANAKAFRSSALDTGDSYSFTFTKVGDYGYFCSLHPHMTGRIIVKAR
ncbi:plastocyanin [Novosphingobium hassiacum]|uniref:Plastocyanin n=1 Tax=Novosphingobium hassiacum TaxID=173676 RepID=A0A7W5ZX80_9SPHN|nr:cupredoxin family copper-binding protein [Novosphingobium hassiacum]MBB3859485.1 plastocyanin [Novosphingobium hassiacum]